jgi:hypothetical protein
LGNSMSRSNRNILLSGLVLFINLRQSLSASAFLLPASYSFPAPFCRAGALEKLIVNLMGINLDGKAEGSSVMKRLNAH